MIRVKYIIILFLCFINLTAVSAACDNSLIKDLSQKAYYIKANYEITDNSEVKDIKVGKDKSSYFIPNFKYDINIYNLNSDLSAKITDNITRESKIITYEMTKNGVYTFQNYDFSNIKHYTIEIIANNNDCSEKRIRTIRMTLPKYNPYSEYTYCKNSSILYCQKFVKQDLNIKNTDEFLKKIGANNDIKPPKKNNNQNSIKSSLLKNWKLYFCVFLSVVFISILFIFIKNKKSKKSGWKL